MILYFINDPWLYPFGCWCFHSRLIWNIFCRSSMSLRGERNNTSSSRNVFPPVSHFVCWASGWRNDLIHTKAHTHLHSFLYLILLLVIVRWFGFRLSLFWFVLFVPHYFIIYISCVVPDSCFELPITKGYPGWNLYWKADGPLWASLWRR